MTDLRSKIFLAFQSLQSRLSECSQIVTKIRQGFLKFLHPFAESVLTLLVFAEYSRVRGCCPAIDKPKNGREALPAA